MTSNRERYHDLTATHGEPLTVYCEDCAVEVPYWTAETKPEVCELCGEALTEEGDDGDR